MGRRRFWHTLALASTVLAANAMLAAEAQETKKISKGSGKYEEHYEILPPEGEPDSSPAPGSGNLDPEGGAPASSPQSNKGAATAPGPSHKSPFVATPPSTRKPTSDPAPATAAYPEPERTEEPAQAPREVLPRNVRRLEQPPAVEQAEEKKRPRPAAAPADEGESTEIPGLAFFYDAVNEGGEWINHPRYGRVFAPKVDDDWRPYTVGRWAFADEYGWVWISDEPFGWATYHYGRWSLDADKGWLWIPAVEWAPSWVVWRQGEDAIGWAPLPASAQFTKKGLSIDANAIENSRFEDAWVFVDPRYFGQAGMRRYLRSTRWNADLVPRTAARVGYQRDGASIANRGLAPEDIEKLSGRPIQRVKIKFADETRLKRSASVSGNGDIKLYRPDSSRMEDLARKLAKKRSREDGTSEISDDSRASDSATASAKAQTEGETKPRKPSAPKAVTKFAPQPVLQRVETESGVTESWVTPQAPVSTEATAKANEEKPATKSADSKHEGKKDVKFTPAKSERTETEGSVTESWASPPSPAHEASPKETPKSASKSTSSKPASRSDTSLERGQGARYESYTVLSPQDPAGAPSADAPSKAKGASVQGAADEGLNTGSTSNSKRRWDGSGASGAPGATVPGTVQ